jgi:uncharacterized membrane protein YczE
VSVKPITIKDSLADLRAVTATRWIKLFTGLLIFALGVGLMIDARVGIPSWDVLHQGLSRVTGVAIGHVTTLISIPILLLWIPLRERPGIATIANAIVIGQTLNVILPLLPKPDALPLQLLQMAIGVLVVALGTAIYVGAQLGRGPRDGLMTGLSRRTGYSVAVCRTAIELTVLAAGWLLGGNVGIGTLIFALGIGPAIQFFFKLLGVKPFNAAPAATAAAK